MSTGTRIKHFPLTNGIPIRTTESRKKRGRHVVQAPRITRSNSLLFEGVNLRREAAYSETLADKQYQQEVLGG